MDSISPPSPSAAATAADEGSSSTVVATVIKGFHLLKVDGYSRTRDMVATGGYIKSCTFHVGGHAWRIRYYPNSNLLLNAAWVSVFLELVTRRRQAAPPLSRLVHAEFRFDLLDGDGAAVPSFRRTVSTVHGFARLGNDWGWSRFVAREELETSGLLRDDDRFAIRCDVSVLNEVHMVDTAAAAEAEDTLVAVPPSDMHRHFGDLLRTQHGVDVTFQVGSDSETTTTFAAHRFVLVARSPLFKAMLCGTMVESSTGVVRINDMEPRVFKAMLHFVYTDELPPEMEEKKNNNSNHHHDVAAVAQHLLVAADKYGLERLKLMCESKLCECVDVSTAATTLVLAEQHHCHGLHKAIMKFLSLPRNMKLVMATEGYDHLFRSCPSLCKELMQKFVDLWT